MLLGEALILGDLVYLNRDSSMALWEFKHTPTSVFFSILEASFVLQNIKHNVPLIHNGWIHPILGGLAPPPSLQYLLQANLTFLGDLFIFLPVD